MPLRLLLTGAPGCGKTTVAVRLVEMLAGWHLRGFVTRELRERQGRVGFEVLTFDGRHAVLAHVDNEGTPRVGRYGVDLGAFEKLALPQLDLRGDTDVYIVDEIGKMECLSTRFVAGVRGLFEAQAPLVATVALRGGGFIDEVKSRPDVEVLHVDAKNRQLLPERLAARLLATPR